MSVKPIHDVDEFLSTFQVGDEFSTINSWKGKPTSVSTLLIRGFLTYDKPESSMHGSWKVRVLNESRRDSIGVYEMFVADLVNNLHGCFVNRSDANRELENRLYGIQESKNNEQIDRLIQLIEELIAELSSGE